MRSLIEPAQVRELTQLGQQNRGVLFSPQNRVLVVGDADGNLKWLNPFDTDSPSKRVISLGHAISPVNFSNDGTRLLLLVREPDRDRCVVVSMPEGSPVDDWEIPSNDPRARLSPSGRLVATGDKDGTLRFWNVSAQDSTHSDITFAFQIEGLAFSPKGDRLVVGLEGGEAAVVDVATGTVTARLQRHFGAVHSVAFSPDGQRILTGGGPGETAKVWDAETYRELITLVDRDTWLSQVGFSPDGKTIYAVGGVGVIHFWNASGQKTGPNKKG